MASTGVSCTISSSGPRGGPGIPSVGQYCRDRIRKVEACGARYEGDKRCAAVYECTTKVVRPEFVPIQLGCSMEDGCKERSEICRQPMNLDLPVNPKFEELKAACARKKAECPNYKVCKIEKLRVVSNLAIDITMKCLDSPCSEIEKCNLKSLFEAVPSCSETWGFAPGR